MRVKERVVEIINEAITTSEDGYVTVEDLARKFQSEGFDINSLSVRDLAPVLGFKVYEGRFVCVLAR